MGYDERRLARQSEAQRKAEQWSLGKNYHGWERNVKKMITDTNCEACITNVYESVDSKNSIRYGCYAEKQCSTCNQCGNQMMKNLLELASTCDCVLHCSKILKVVKDDCATG